jgi:hypothetical protein
MDEQNELRALITFFFFSKVVFDQLEVPGILKDNAWRECICGIRNIVKPEYSSLVDHAIEEAQRMVAFKHSEEIRLKNSMPPDIKMSDSEKSVAEQLAKIFAPK